MVDDSRYPTSNQSICQQMSLPLTYDDGINLLPKRCDQDEAYFVCESPSKIQCIFTLFSQFAKRCQLYYLRANIHKLITKIDAQLYAFSVDRLC